MLLQLLQAPKRFKTTNPSTQKTKQTNKEKKKRFPIFGPLAMPLV
jgi:small neutral amino acid transporter SnatA (MarC family)